jgi:ferric-dicitrate binding protein FerR (iron transport regulator)
MLNKNDEFWAALASVINENSTKREDTLVEDWLQEDAKNSDIFEYLKRIGYNDSLDKAYNSKDKIYYLTKEKIRKQLYKRRIRLWQYASAACLAALIFIGSLTLPGLLEDNTLAVSRVETKCPYGIKSAVTLSDGSIVELNAGSMLTYPIVFSGKERVVMLKGEAFFDIKNKNNQPFIVNVNDCLNIRVLGTKFNIKAYEEDGKIITTLLKGSVSVEKLDFLSNQLHSFLLEPNQQIVFDRKTNEMDIREVDAALFTTWLDDAYFFDNESFVEIMHKLERGFNIKINLNSKKLENEFFSGIFDKGENIYQILDRFKESRYFNYKITKGTIEISDK